MNKDIPFNPLEGEKPEITFKLNDTTDELVSIIIVHKDRPEFLNIALQTVSVCSTNNNIEIIVVDNNSGKDSQAFLDDIQGQVKVIRNDKNLFWSAACKEQKLQVRVQNILYLCTKMSPLLISIG